MSIEDAGDPGTRPATPSWRVGGDRGSQESTSAPDPVMPDLGDASLPGENPDPDDEELDQFDWDSWQPADVADDAPAAEEVDWDSYAGPAETPETGSWREKVIGESDWAREFLLGDLESLEPLPSSATSPEAEEEEKDEEEVATSLARPLPASGRPWPPAGAVSRDVVHVRVAPWAPFTTGLALALAMVRVSAAFLSPTGRLGLMLPVLTGQVPTTADAVVDAYLSAIARGDATKAISYLAAPPANPLLLTDAVLRRSNQHSPFTVVSVKAGASSLDGTQRVAATYRIGDVEVSTAFTTAFAEGQWLIRDDPGRIGVGALRAAGTPLYIDGQEVPESIESLPAFPGTYELATGSRFIEYAAPGTIVVRSSDEAPIIGAVQLRLTDAGLQAALDAVKAAVAGCLARKELQPAGCPQNIEQNRNESVLPQTISYSAANESTTVSQSELRLSTVTVAYTASWKLAAKVDVNGVPRDIVFPFTATALWKVVLTTERPTAVLG
ncbi:MAG: hypothetical protein HY829_00540 [Actinobacteria bacterium]|nr:hypothetical protein [Actinomycetota bacterium]